MLESLFYPLFFDSIIAEVNLETAYCGTFRTVCPMLYANIKSNAQSSKGKLCCRIGKPYAVELKEERQSVQCNREKQAWFDIHQQGRNVGLFHRIKISADASGDAHH